jgi:hypothetical protein
MATAIPWTEYVSAWGSLAAIVIALVSVGIAAVAWSQARDSAADSSRSADAAERTALSAKEISEASKKALEAATAQLEVATREHERQEAERARQPIVDRIALTDVVPAEGEDPAIGVFRVAFTNSGTRDLTDAYLTILFVRGSASELMTGRWGDPDSSGSRDSTRERWPGPDGSPRDLDYVVKPVSAQRGFWRLQYVRIQRQGMFPIRVKLFHADLAGDGPWIDAWVHVEEDGKTRIQNIDTENPEAFEGRLNALRQD